MKITIGRGLLESVMELARELHPQEVVLLLRGKVSRGEILIEDFLLPPFASAGLGFAQFPSHMLPIDFSIVGTAHSHPSGSVSPSVTDLNHFYGRVMLILAHPYRETSVAAYNSRGERLPFSLEG
jgi:proteasome lid subunit RPN8/RPN11